MVEEAIGGVEFIGVNTDKQALTLCKAPTIIQIGEKLTKGLGAGAKPEIGEKLPRKASRRSNRPSRELIWYLLPVVWAAVQVPELRCSCRSCQGKWNPDRRRCDQAFPFEAKTRMSNALAGIEKLKENVDTLIIIPNDRLLEIVDRRTSMPEALKKADEVLQQAVQGITDLNQPAALINLDFADVQTVMIDKVSHISVSAKEKATTRLWKLFSRLYPVRCWRQLSRVLPM